MYNLRPSAADAKTASLLEAFVALSPVAVSADFPVIEVLLRAAVTSLTASVTFSTMADMVDGW